MNLTRTITYRLPISLKKAAIEWVSAKYTVSIAAPELFADIFMTDIKNVNKKLRSEGMKNLPKNTIVYDMSWREITEKVSYESMHPTVKDIFVLGKDYKRTDQYKKMMKAVGRFQRGETINPSREGAYWCRSEEDVGKYFEILKDCYKSISCEGFLSQSELFELSGSEIGDGSVVRSFKDEIELIIDDCGDLVFSSRRANHRFSIAKALESKSVPFRLVGISKYWLSSQFDLNAISLDKVINRCIETHPAISKYIPLSDRNI